MWCTRRNYYRLHQSQSYLTWNNGPTSVPLLVSRILTSINALLSNGIASQCLSSPFQGEHGFFEDLLQHLRRTLFAKSSITLVRPWTYEEFGGIQTLASMSTAIFATSSNECCKTTKKGFSNKKRTITHSLHHLYYSKKIKKSAGHVHLPLFNRRILLRHAKLWTCQNSWRGKNKNHYIVSNPIIHF